MPTYILMNGAAEGQDFIWRECNMNAAGRADPVPEWIVGSLLRAQRSGGTPRQPKDGVGKERRSTRYAEYTNHLYHTRCRAIVGTSTNTESSELQARDRISPELSKRPGNIESPTESDDVKCTLERVDV